MPNSHAATALRFAGTHPNLGLGSLLTPPWGGILDLSKSRPANTALEKHRAQGSLPLDWAVESAGQSRRTQVHRGKSGLHRAECQVTPGQRELTASATESRPPNGIFGCAW